MKTNSSCPPQWPGYKPIIDCRENETGRRLWPAYSSEQALKRVVGKRNTQREQALQDRMWKYRILIAPLFHSYPENYLR